MALTITDLTILQTYIEGVMARSKHHAPGVDSVPLSLMGGIMWKARPGSVSVREQDGDAKNVLWCEIGRQRWAFCYNHGTDQIEIRQATIRGRVVYICDNSTTHAEIRRLFEMLASGQVLPRPAPPLPHVLPPALAQVLGVKPGTTP